jgi:hypothetical protein
MDTTTAPQMTIVNTTATCTCGFVTTQGDTTRTLWVSENHLKSHMYQTRNTNTTRWTVKELRDNGGHTPECEQACHTSCPIRAERADDRRRQMTAETPDEHEARMHPFGRGAK